MNPIAETMVVGMAILILVFATPFLFSIISTTSGVEGFFARILPWATLAFLTLRLVFIWKGGTA